jgi:hypothetical protein
MTDDRAPLEQCPERIPEASDLARIRDLMQWADHLHESVRDPWGVCWNEIFIVLACLGDLSEWGMDAATRIDGRYRYRVDAPLAPSLADNLPDYVPDSWTKDSR